MEWISVKDSLPPREADVLCYGSDGTPPFVAALFGRVPSWESFIDGGEKSRVVTHWMPLPPLPIKE